MESTEFLTYFRTLMPRFMLYLAVPVYLGLQLGFVASDERKAHEDNHIGSYALDVVALVFAVLVPAFMIISSFAILKLGDRHPEFLAGVFRFGMMFLFLGVWWQFFGIMALKAYRDREKKISKPKYFAFYAAASVFISLNAFLGGEWFLKWMSLGFLALAAPLLLLSCRKMCLGYLAAAVLAFCVQTVGFIYVSAMI